MKTLVLVLLVGVSCIGSELLPPGKTCQNLSLSDLYVILDNCREGQIPHCLLDDKNRHVRVCVKAETIPKGKCPFYISKSNMMDKRECSGKDCPEEDFPSTAAVKYEGCFKEFRFEPLSPGKTCPNLKISELYSGDFLDTCMEGQIPHCLLDDQNRHGRVCIKAETIPIGECPFYNSKRDMIDKRECTGKNCPEEGIPSTAAAEYEGCFKEFSSKDEL